MAGSDPTDQPFRCRGSFGEGQVSFLEIRPKRTVRSRNTEANTAGRPNQRRSIQYTSGTVEHAGLRAPQPIDDEGLADVEAANPFCLPRNRFAQLGVVEHVEGTVGGCNRLQGFPAVTGSHAPRVGAGEPGASAATRRVQGWRHSLLVVRPETLVGWDRQGFRRSWAWRSRRRSGRPTISAELRDLIRRMSSANPMVNDSVVRPRRWIPRSR